MALENLSLRNGELCKHPWCVEGVHGFLELLLRKGLVAFCFQSVGHDEKRDGLVSLKFGQDWCSFS